MRIYLDAYFFKNQSFSEEVTFDEESMEGKTFSPLKLKRYFLAIVKF